MFHMKHFKVLKSAIAQKADLKPLVWGGVLHIKKLVAANKSALCVLTHSGQKQIYTLRNRFSRQDFSEKQKF